MTSDGGRGPRSLSRLHYTFAWTIAGGLCLAALGMAAILFGVLYALSSYLWRVIS